MRKKLVILFLSSIAILAVGAAMVQMTQRRARESLEHCVGILGKIEACKDQLAIEFKPNPDATPTWEEIINLEKSAKPSWAHCPSGGIYTIGRFREPASCSIVEHQRAFEAYVRANPSLRLR